MAYEIDLSGRVALVTGASSGLGAQFAKTLAAAGAGVVLASRRVDKLKDLRAEIEAAGGNAHVVAMDVTDKHSIAAAVAHAETEMGSIDILVNNAGAMIRRAPLADLDDALFDEVVPGDADHVHILRMQGLHPIAEGEVLLPGSGDGEKGWIHIGQGAVGVGDDDALGALFNGQRQLAQLFFGLVPFADILHRADRRQRLAGVVEKALQQRSVQRDGVADAGDGDDSLNRFFRKDPAHSQGP